MNKVSVIITTYNSELYIRDALNSAINQSYENIEILVIDNNSTDKTLDIVNSIMQNYPKLIKLYFEKNQGANYARNLGVDKATGDYIQFLDSDDILLNNKLHEQMKVFMSYSLVDVVYSDYEKYNNDFSALMSLVSFDTPNNILEKTIKHVISIQNPLYKKSSLLSVNLFDTNLKSAQDWDLNMRLVLNGYNFYYLKGVYSKIRQVSNSLSSDWVSVTQNQCRVVFKNKELIIKSNNYNTNIEFTIKIIHYNTLLYIRDKESFDEIYNYYLFWHSNYKFINNKLKRYIAVLFGIKILITLNKIFK